jgi:hypothetical protein
MRPGRQGVKRPYPIVALINVKRSDLLCEIRQQFILRRVGEEIRGQLQPLKPCCGTGAKRFGSRLARDREQFAGAKMTRCSAHTSPDVRKGYGTPILINRHGCPARRAYAGIVTS